MENMFSRYKFKACTLNFRVVTYYTIGLKKHIEYTLPDSDYGRLIIFQNNLPKFIVMLINKNGEESSIVNYANKNNLIISDLILDMLTLRGYENISFKNEIPLISWRLNTEYLEKIEMLKIEEEWVV